jgi:hypothetical protein
MAVVMQQSRGTYVSVVIAASYFARNIYQVVSSVDERAGKPVKITGSGGQKGGPKPKFLAYVFVFFGNIIIGPFYKLTLSAQTKVTLQLTVSLSDLLSRFLARPP